MDYTPELFHLAVAHVKRSEFKRPEDAIYAAKYLRQIWDQPHEALVVYPNHEATKLLVYALAIQVVSGAGNVVQIIGELAALCRELLTWDMSDAGTTNSIAYFAQAVSRKTNPWALDQPLDQVIECLRMARNLTHKPGLHFPLAHSLSCRYYITLADDDYKEAVSIYDEINNFLERLADQRLLYFGPIEGLETRSGNLPSTLLDKYDNDESEHGRMHPRVKHLGGLLTVIRRDDITAIDEAIEKGRTILVSSAPIYPHVLYVSGLFGAMLFEAFKQDQHLLSTGLLAQALLTRSGSFPEYCTQDDEEAMKLLFQCANHPQASLPDRFLYACLCADTARSIHYPSSHPSISTAYKSAMSSMQNTLHFAPTLQLQHTTLATTDTFHRMPLEYASYQIELGQLDEAIGALERGRALLWSEMRYLRTSVDQLLDADPDLGSKFAAINGDLEDLTKSIPPSHNLSIDDIASNDLKAERNKLIPQIRTLSGFGNFLASPSFDTLRSVASCGLVIIINHSKWRSDILILLHNTSPSLIPTPHDFYHRATALKDRLFDSRLKYGLDSTHYDQTLASVLAELYKLSRIWWCPTSVFCSLPLHAMDPIPSDDGEKLYFLDLYICSYTPTLTALIQSRNRSSSPLSLDRPSLLLVAQPDPSLPTVGGEIQVVWTLNTKVTSLISDAATPATVIDGFHHHRFVHFACHGRVEAVKPFGVGFELYRGERLTLLDLVRSHLPASEFAFLSACHTAEVTEGSVADEVLHLTAAVQYCGFKSVVGTKTDETPYHERSAKALRSAVKKLRRKRRITLER
ncbi:CHAT domain-containing protein [Lactarius vividus]|nr:CHAT domain-containing protein [Lactarius vividus]